MELQQLIEQFSDGSGSEKTASEDPKGSSMQDDTANLKEALKDTLESEQSKTASNSDNPVGDLMKLAEELAGVDKEAEESFARTLGMAFADSAHRRWAELNEKVGTVTPPVLQATPTSEPSLDDAVKVAATQGYNDAKAILGQEKPAQEKQASDAEILEELVKKAEAGDAESQRSLQKIAAEYEDGQEAALQTIHKVASEEFIKGAAEVQVLIQHLQNQS